MILPTTPITPITPPTNAQNAPVERAHSRPEGAALAPQSFEQRLRERTEPKPERTSEEPAPAPQNTPEETAGSEEVPTIASEDAAEGGEPVLQPGATDLSSELPVPSFEAVPSLPNGEKIGQAIAQNPPPEATSSPSISVAGPELPALPSEPQRPAQPSGVNEVSRHASPSTDTEGPAPVDAEAPKESAPASTKPVRTDQPASTDSTTTHPAPEAPVVVEPRVASPEPANNEQARTAAQSESVGLSRPSGAETEGDASASDERRSPSDQRHAPEKADKPAPVSHPSRPAPERAEVRSADPQPQAAQTVSPERVGDAKLAESPAPVRTIATPTPSANSSAQPSDPQISVEAQVSRGVGAALSQRGGSITLKLSPENLGSVKVSLQIDQGAVSLDVEATTERAHQALTKELGALRASLESRGMRIERANVHLAPSPIQTTGPADGSQRGSTQEHTGDEARDDQPQHERDGRRDRNDQRDQSDRAFERYAARWGHEGFALGLSAEA